MKLNELTLTNALKLIADGKVDVTDIHTDVAAAIARQNPKLNMYLAVDADSAAKAAEMAGKPLAGVPVAVKDNFLTVGLETTASSNVLRGFKPPYESTVTRKLKENGGVIVGKTNMDAWAHGSSTETSDFGPTLNPNNPDHLPGGSSGGSAAAIAADTAIVAIGSETAGSIRQPSAWCGVVGLKPTYGRVSRTGVVAMGSSLDCPGPIGKTVEDTTILLAAIAGHDPYDATTSTSPVPDFRKSVGASVKGMKIGICYIDHPKLKGSAAGRAIEDAGKRFEKLGARVSLVPLSEQLEEGRILTPDYAIGVYTVVQRGEVSSNLARYDGIRYGHDRSAFGAEAKRRIMLGTFTLSKGYADRYYVKAQQVRSLYINNFRQLFSAYDVLISPTSPGYALEKGASFKSPMFGELEDMLLEPSSISGLPGVNVPCHHDPETNLYLGMNIIADHWQEGKAIAVAAAYERETPWNRWINQTV
jgi:aspartyl-tRNA(Asn)/glutamyl-tRNA(Gln) amidotransferase subunit A